MDLLQVGSDIKYKRQAWWSILHKATLLDEIIEIMSSPTEFKLNTGATIPAIGLGTWQAKPGEVRAAVSHALKDGYTHLDCALCYQVSSPL